MLSESWREKSRNKYLINFYNQTIGYTNIYKSLITLCVMLKYFLFYNTGSKEKYGEGHDPKTIDITVFIIHLNPIAATLFDWLKLVEVLN
jgi:hypothetical protein